MEKLLAYKILQTELIGKHPLQTGRLVIAILSEYGPLHIGLHRVEINSGSFQKKKRKSRGNWNTKL